MLNSSAINSNHSSLEAGLETGKGWCVSNDSRPYLTIDFGKLVTVSKIETQGAVYDGESYFLSSYNLKFGYSNPRWFDDVERGQVKVIILPLIYTSKGVRFLEFQTVVCRGLEALTVELFPLKIPKICSKTKKIKNHLSSYGGG